jgi:hypothetical protein
MAKLGRNTRAAVNPNCMKRRQMDGANEAVTIRPDIVAGWACRLPMI